jgi:hypothetical protein
MQSERDVNEYLFKSVGGFTIVVSWMYNFSV